ncbi:MAG TPA: hypothetical protein VEB86_03285, partial [Chryseosolibacter sp.]|nr:hypothetical protein [Chryseosolibacter sp.]
HARGVYDTLESLRDIRNYGTDPMIYLSLCLGFIFASIVNLYVFYLSRAYPHRDHHRALSITAAFFGLAIALIFLFYLIGVYPQTGYALATAMLLALHWLVMRNQRNYFLLKRRESMPVDVDPYGPDRFAGR